MFYIAQKTPSVLPPVCPSGAMATRVTPNHKTQSSNLWLGMSFGRVHNVLIVFLVFFSCFDTPLCTNSVLCSLPKKTFCSITSILHSATWYLLVPYISLPKFLEAWLGLLYYFYGLLEIFICPDPPPYCMIIERTTRRGNHLASIS